MTNKADEKLDEIIHYLKAVQYPNKHTKESIRILESLKSENREKWVMDYSPKIFIYQYELDAMILNEGEGV